MVLDPALLYALVLTAEILGQVVLQEVGQTEDRIFPPLATLATFLFQILSNDHFCRNAVARLRAWRVDLLELRGGLDGATMLWRQVTWKTPHRRCWTMV
jgi:hypothetical protein